MKSEDRSFEPRHELTSMPIPVALDRFYIFLKGEEVRLLVAAHLAQDLVSSASTPLERVAGCFALETNEKLRNGGDTIRFSHVGTVT